MRGRVRNNCFSLRVGVAQKATFARDAARCVARAVNGNVHATSQLLFFAISLGLAFFVGKKREGLSLTNVVNNFAG